MLYTDVRELKAVLEIDPLNTEEDKKLLFFIEQVSEWFQEWLNRPSLFYQQRTQYYKGTGTQNLLLRARPVDSSQTITVIEDLDHGYYGSNSASFTSPPLVYGTDYCLRIDQDDGITSRCGILVRINDIWEKPINRQTGLLSPFVGEDTGSYKVTYTAGYTIDTLPASIRLACNMAIARLRTVMPLGVETSSEGYEERSISVVTSEKLKIFALVKPLLFPFQNRNW